MLQTVRVNGEYSAPVVKCTCVPVRDIIFDRVHVFLQVIAGLIPALFARVCDVRCKEVLHICNCLKSLH